MASILEYASIISNNQIYVKDSYFVDGTVEGTNISFPNEQVNAEFTFYGNGCRISTGSKVACETRQVSTYDNETQNNGTMYSIASAFTRYSTPGTTTDNSNSPDTFCPLGWQLPYGGTGGDYYNQPKSWRYLIETAYSLTKSEPGSQAMNSYPISYVPGGGYELRSGVYYNQGAAGLYWTSTRNDGSKSYRYYIGSNTYIIEANSNGYGYAVRCTKFLASNHRRHGGRNTCRFNYI